MKVESDYNKKSKPGGKTDFVKIAESSSFRQLSSRRKKFIVPYTIFFLIFYFSLPVLTSYTNILNTRAIGDISWAWMLAFAQFIMTWVLCTIYVRKSTSFDSQIDKIVQDIEKGGEPK